MYIIYIYIYCCHLVIKMTSQVDNVLFSHGKWEPNLELGKLPEAKQNLPTSNVFQIIYHGWRKLKVPYLKYTKMDFTLSMVEENFENYLPQIGRIGFTITHHGYREDLENCRPQMDRIRSNIIYFLFHYYLFGGRKEHLAQETRVI